MEWFWYICCGSAAVFAMGIFTRLVTSAVRLKKGNYTEFTLDENNSWHGGAE